MSQTELKSISAFANPSPNPSSLPSVQYLWDLKVNEAGQEPDLSVAAETTS